MATDFTRNFSLLNVIATEITVNSTSQRVALPVRAGEDVMIYNTSQRTIYVRTGGPNVEAVAEGDPNPSMPIPKGEKGVYHKGGTQATHIALITKSQSALVFVIPGTGV